MEDLTIYEQLSIERKELQAIDQIPQWFTTGGWQMFKQKYQVGDETIRGAYIRIADAAALHMPNPVVWANKFFELMWEGHLGLSTPILANMGTNRGMPVSCSGQLIDDSISDFYMSQHELAVLTKHGFGTSSYLGNIRPRGSTISKGGKASGVIDVITSCVDIMNKVAQGTARRGAWAGYLPITHGDFDEVVDYLEHHPDGLNMGWVITDDFIQLLNNGNKEAINKLKRAMKVKAVTGKGYFFFVDKVNRHNPEMYKDLDLKVLASNLCIEINLFSDSEHSFTCVLASMNLANWHLWKDTDAVFTATVFLDCIAQEFIEQGKQNLGFEKTVRFTEKSRALGLGVCGFHTYLQQEDIPFEAFEAHMWNNEVFSHLQVESTRASQWMASELGEPLWCEGYGLRNTHRTAIAPTTTLALICGGVSQGIEPVVANIYNQPTAAGELYRVNPVFLKLAKDRGKFTEELVEDLTLNTAGSVQHLDWLTGHEKLVFKTAYEIDQRAIIRLASARQKFICQGQSLNLFFDADEDEEYMMEIHQEAFLDENIKGLYYMRTAAGVSASKGECLACQ